MILGFNTDVAGKDGDYHVQTEDRGAKSPVIESIVYMGGKILGRRRTSYIPAEVPQEEIEETVRSQHREVVEAIRAGAWVPAAESPAKSLSQPPGYAIRLLNPTDILHGDFLRFQLSVRDREQHSPAGEVTLDIRWLLGGAVAEKQSLHSRADGAAEVWFPMPTDRVYATLLICAQGPGGRELAKFHVRGTPA